MALTCEIMMEFCRLCQSHLGKTPLHYDEELINKIAEVVRIQVNDELTSYLPMLVCLSCQEKILDIYNYIQTVQKVDENLRSAVKKRYFTDFENIVGGSNNIQIYEDTYKCDKCSSTFADLNLMEEHNQSHTEETSNYQCLVCFKIYDTETSYIEHKKTHLAEFYCDKCCKTFNCDSEQKMHECISNIEVESAGVESHVNCKTKFKMKAEVVQFRTFPQEGEPFQCNTCGKKLKSRNYLLRHLKHHQNFIYSEENHLEEPGRPFLCVTCGKNFRTKGSLSCHEKIHSDKKGYKCELCNIGFYVRSNLRAHEKKYHEGIRFYCSQCTKVFLSKNSLERHEKTHIGIREFKCDHCASAFYTKKELLKHQRYHQDLRQYKCGECFKTFFERHHLTIHLRTHSGERPYVCKIPGCGKAFAESQKLKRHHNAKHNAIS